MTREDWEVVKLGNVVSYTTGKLDSNAMVEGGKYPYFTCSQEVFAINEYAFDQEAVLLGGNNANAIFPLKYYVGKFNAYQRTYVMQTKNKEILLTHFLYYVLRPQLEHFKSISTGSTTKFLTKQILDNLEISLPPLHEQQRIASILSAYDDLIENNTRRIALLEQMAQTLYRQWFVEYKFPGHQDVEMVESGTEFGMIPQGWEVKKIGEMVENFDNQRKPLSTMVRLNKQGKYPYYGAAKVIDYVDDYIFDGKYLLLAEDGSVITTGGKPVLQYVDERFWVSNHAHILRGKGISTNFLYIFFSQVDIGPYITGAAQPKISQGNLNRIHILIPSRDILDKFDNNIGSIIKDVFSLQKQNQSLKEQRDILLRKLIG